MIVFLDLDGTLCDDRWRRQAIPDWDAYHAGIPNDKPRDIVREFCESLVDGFLILLTGRPEKHRGATMEWLRRYDVPYDDLLMRPNDDYASNAELKHRILTDFMARGGAYKNDVLVIDNNQKVADRLRTDGFEVWLVE